MSKKCHHDLRRRRTDKVTDVLHKCRRKCTPNAILRAVCHFFPIAYWLPRYDWKSCLFHDISGGLSMAVLAVPQGIALAGIAGVEPVYGLYTAIFPAFIYMVFGHSRYTALGGSALLSLMTRTAIGKVMAGVAHLRNCTHIVNETALMLNETDYLELNGFEWIPSEWSNASGIREVVMEEWTEGYREVRPIHIATTIMFLSGILHFLMGVLRLDFLSSYFSEHVISGFIVGGSVHVFFAQIGDAVGVQLPRRDGVGYLYDRVFDCVQALPFTHLPTLIISLCSVSFMLFSQLYMQPWLANVFSFPIPYELILVIVGITATNFADLSTHHSIKVVGNIPTEFPPPMLPRVDLIPAIFVDSFSIAFTAVTIHLTVAVIAKQRYHYHFDNWRELYSLGFVGVFSSFFPVFPVTSVFARSIVGNAVHSTQMTVCFSSMALLAVILYIGPVLEYLPKCVLASMVIVSLIGSFRKISEAWELWPTFKCDLLIFVMSAVLTVCCDMSTGLILSVAFAMFTVIVRNQLPRWHILARVPDTPNFRETTKHEFAYLQGQVCVMRFDAPLIFTSVKRFNDVVRRNVKRWERREANTLRADTHGYRWRCCGNRAMVVVDCSGFSYVDHLGLKTLMRIFLDLESDGVVVKFAAAKTQLFQVFNETDFFKHVPNNAYFAHVADAVSACEESARNLEHNSPR